MSIFQKGFCMFNFIIATILVVLNAIEPLHSPVISLAVYNATGWAYSLILTFEIRR